MSATQWHTSLEVVSNPGRNDQGRHLVRRARGRRVEKRCPPQRGLRPAQVRDLRGSHAAGALYDLRVSRKSEGAANETLNPDLCLRSTARFRNYL